METSRRDQRSQRRGSARLIFADLPLAIRRIEPFLEADLVVDEVPHLVRSEALILETIECTFDRLARLPYDTQ